MMPLWLDIILALLLVIGAVVALIGSIGLVRLNRFYQRLHGPTKASTLGVGFTLIASILLFSVNNRSVSLHELLITGFVFLTAPISAHMLIRAVLANRDSDELPPLPHRADATAIDDSKSQSGVG
jgi:multicomponent K+:H+ antiporter subunit G